MSLQSAINRFPRQVPGPGGEDYVRVDGRYAVRSGAAVESGPATLANGGIRVQKVDERGDPPDDGEVTAVYAQKAGPIAVPTGEVFVRFAEDVRAEARLEELSNAGYEVAKIPSYAPNAAWVRAQGGDVADSLRNIAALRRLPGVQNVEAQMAVELTRR
jgi:hypothetical protein